MAGTRNWKMEEPTAEVGIIFNNDYFFACMEHIYTEYITIGLKK